MYRFRKRVNNDHIQNVREIIIDHTYHDRLEIEYMFFFNVKYDEKKQPLIANGEDKSLLNIMMTSMKLMTYVEMPGVFHLDGTYK